MFRKIDEAYVDEYKTEYRIIAEDNTNDDDKTLGQIDNITGKVIWLASTTEEEQYNKDVKVALDRFYEYHLFPKTMIEDCVKNLKYHLNMPIGDEISATIYMKDPYTGYADPELAAEIYIEGHRLLNKKYLVFGKKDTDDIITIDMEKTTMDEIVNRFMLYVNKCAGQTNEFSIVIED